MIRDLGSLSIPDRFTPQPSLVSPETLAKLGNRDNRLLPSNEPTAASTLGKVHSIPTRVTADDYMTEETQTRHRYVSPFQMSY